MTPIALKVLSPAISGTVAGMYELIDDLTRMRCQKLLARPWMLKDEAMVIELVEGPGNQWDHTIRGR